MAHAQMLASMAQPGIHLRLCCMTVSCPGGMSSGAVNVSLCVLSCANDVDTSGTCRASMQLTEVLVELLEATLSGLASGLEPSAKGEGKGTLASVGKLTGKVAPLSAGAFLPARYVISNRIPLTCHPSQRYHGPQTGRPCIACRLGIPRAYLASVARGAVPKMSGSADSACRRMRTAEACGRLLG